MNAAQGNQSNNESTQVNVGQSGTTMLHPTFYSSPMPSLLRMTPAPESPTYSFFFGTMIPPDCEPEEDADPLPIAAVPPTMSSAQKRDIRNTGIAIQRKYNDILDVSKKLRRRCIIRLRSMAINQRSSLKRHIEAIGKWPEQALECTQQTSPYDHAIHSRREYIQKTLHSIEELVNTVADQVPDLVEYCKQEKTRKVRVEKSTYFKTIEESINKVQNCITSIESQVFQNSATRRPLESTQGFARLFIASLATRTLYRCLCKACPLTGHERGHDRHSALVCLVPVPGKEPLSIKPNGMALIAHLIAIESTLNHGLIWFEANSTLRIPCKSNDTCPASQSILTDLRSRRDSGYSSSSSKDEFGVSRLRDGGNYDQIQVCPGSLAQGSDHLAMCIGDEETCGHQIFYLREDRRPNTSTKPLILSHIIDQGQQRGSDRELFKLSHELKKIRFKMATRIAEATLRYGWSEWLGETWDSGNVVFYPIGNELLPFLRIQMGDRGSVNHCNFLSCLGIVLLEVGLWEGLRTLKMKRIFDGDLIEQYLTRLLEKSGQHYQEVVQYCLQFSGTEDDGSFQETFYQKVVSPLRKLASL